MHNVAARNLYGKILMNGPDDGSVWLRNHGIEELLVTGIRTEQCCETTTRHASDADSWRAPLQPAGRILASEC